MIRTPLIRTLIIRTPLVVIRTPLVPSLFVLGADLIDNDEVKLGGTQTRKIFNHENFGGEGDC